MCRMQGQPSMWLFSSSVNTVMVMLSENGYQSILATSVIVKDILCGQNYKSISGKMNLKDFDLSVG